MRAKEFLECITDVDCYVMFMVINERRLFFPMVFFRISLPLMAFISRDSLPERSVTLTASYHGVFE